MSKLQFEDYEIYYECSNNDKQPLLILNGILMNVRSWDVFISELEKDFNVIRIDFLDQVHSSSANESYTIDKQVEIVQSLVQLLQLTDYNVLGISYGSHVALKLAAKDNNIKKLLVFNCVSYTNDILKAVGESWQVAADANNATLFYDLAIPIIYSKDFYEENQNWFNTRKNVLVEMFSKDFLERASRLVDSSVSYNICDEVSNINAQSLVVGCDEDLLTPPKLTKEVAQLLNTNYIEITNCGHATMYEKPNEFIAIVIGFMKSDYISIM